MKRLFTLFTGLCVMLLAGCNDEYDDSALVKRLDDFEQRLERLERLCNDMNTNLGSMQTIVTALDRGDYITSVEPLTENGSMVGLHDSVRQGDAHRRLQRQTRHGARRLR